MTKKDYELIAEVIARVTREASLKPNQYNILDEVMGSRLKTDNPSFDHSKFSQYIETCMRLSDDFHYIYKGRVVAKHQK